MKRAKKDPAAWRETAKGLEAYRAARAEAQAKANETGWDYGLEANDVFQNFRVFLLPQRANRYGFETRCEVVSCEDITRVQKGHGP